MFRQIILLLLLVTGLGGCTTAKLDALREVELPQDPFRSALAAQYRQLAESEAEQYDWVSSWVYADKGLRATYGQEVPPELPEDWSLPKDKQPILEAAHQELLAALTPKAREAYPQIAANAQAFYDCWVEQQTENWQEKDIAACRQGFEEAMKALRAPQAASRTTAPKGLPQEVSFSTSFLMFFGWNRSDLNKSARDVLQNVLAYLRTVDGAYEIVLNGHTDRSGDEEHNLTLSNRRAEMVRDALIHSGVEAARISVFGFGESDPRVPTRNGAREPANRRVEIFIE